MTERIDETAWRRWGAGGFFVSPETAKKSKEGAAAAEGGFALARMTGNFAGKRPRRLPALLTLRCPGTGGLWASAWLILFTFRWDRA